MYLCESIHKKGIFMENPLMVSLILSKVNFDLILSGKKKTEYRDLSDRNLSLFVDDPFGGNPQFKPIKHDLFIKGEAFMKILSNEQN